MVKIGVREKGECKSQISYDIGNIRVIVSGRIIHQFAYNLGEGRSFSKRKYGKSD